MNVRWSHAGIVAAVGAVVVAIIISLQPSVPVAVEVSPDQQAIDTFWSWFRTNIEPISANLEEQLTTELSQSLDRITSSIHPTLSWEVGGSPGERKLTLASVSLAGRRVAQQWKKSAPVVPGWLFQVSRGGGPDAVNIVIRAADGDDIAVKDARFVVTVEKARRRANLQVFHPALETAAPEEQQNLARVFTHLVLGDDETLSYVGTIEPLLKDSPDAVPAPLLGQTITGIHNFPQVVSQTNEKGASGEDELLQVDLGVKALDHLSADQLLVVDFQSNADPDLIERAEKTLRERLGSHGVFVARRFSRSAVRSTFYVDGLASTRALLEDFQKDEPLVKKVTITPDPEWAEYAQF